MITSYDFQNQVRDVVPLLDYINQNNPKLISKIATAGVARAKTHEWTEGLIGGKTLAGTGAAMNFVLTNASDYAYLSRGMTVKIIGAPQGPIVTTITSWNDLSDGGEISFAGEEVASGIDGATGIKLYGSPVVSGSKSGQEVAWQGTTRLNYTQIFRRDATLTGSAVATSTYDNANNMNTQVMAAMEALQADLNLAVWYGKKQLGSGNVAGTLGGLYEFCTDNIVDAGKAALSIDKINALIQKIVKGGGKPNTIVIARDLAPALSNLYKDQVIIGEDSNVRGLYVNKIKDAFGNILDVIYDDELAPNHLWVMDISKVKLVPMEGRAFTDKDSTPAGFDGFARTIIGEYTIEVYNPNECFGYIKNIG